MGVHDIHRVENRRGLRSYNLSGGFKGKQDLDGADRSKATAMGHLHIFGIYMERQCP